jgi:flagellar basal body-associated protein FliL
MSDKQDKKAEAPAPAAASSEKTDQAKGGGLMSKTPVLLGGVMIIEAVVLFAGIKFIGGGSHPVQGAELTTTEGGDKRKTVEINVIDFKTPNRQTGRLFLYDVSIFVVTKGEFADKLKEMIKDREALIKDRIRTIIAVSDPEKLGGGSEPGLETLRRQVKYQLDEIIGEGMIDEVLIPRCTPFRVDF